MRQLHSVFAFVLALSWAFDSTAEVVAHFRVQSLNGGCLVDPHEPFPLGDPERFFRLAIFDAGAGPIAGCPNGCTGDASAATADGQTADACTINTGCGFWDFTDVETTKVTANRSGANFYFGLFDQDGQLGDPAADLLGDHWVSAAGPTSGTFSNNNASPYDPTSATAPIDSVCGTPVESTGNSGNYSFSYSIFFQDTTPPTAISLFRASDDGMATVVWDNDSSLNLTWNPASDANSGIAAQTLSLFDVTLGSYVLLNSAISASATSVSICSASCALAFSPVHGHQYRANVSSTNGLEPPIVDAVAATSSPLTVSVDLVSPTTALTSPPANTWFGAGNQTISVSDSDSGSGLATCSRSVSSGGSGGIPQGRTCNASFLVSVGPSQMCNDEGVSACGVTADSTDAARRSSPIATRFFNVDFSSDAIAQLLAFTEPGGAAIPGGVPQSDATPTFVWTTPTSLAPISGYSYALGVDPDCSADTTANSVSLGPFAPGATVFGVRALDQAGNCGAISSFALVVAAATPVHAFGWPGRALLVGLLALAPALARRRRR